MTKQESRDHLLSRLPRRSVLQSTAVLLSVPFVAKAAPGWAQEKLAGTGEIVVFSFGGSFTDGARRNVFDPFTKATGIKIVDVMADFAVPQVRAMFRAGRVDWDIAFVEAQNYPDMHEAGMFEAIDYSLWDQDSLDGTPPDTRRNDAVVGGTTSLLLTYDERAFPTGGPQNWSDFWDINKFPGPRGLFAPDAKRNIQFALLATGVSPKDIWPMTDDKIDLAFKKLGEIQPHLNKWWSAGGEAPQLLISRELVMTSAYDNRSILAIRQGAPIRLVWEGAYLNRNYATILKGGPNTGNAQKLLAFLNRPQIAAAWTLGTGWPGPNAHQLKYLPTDLGQLLNINPENASKAILEDPDWLAAKRPDGKTNAEHLQERWLKWKAR